MAPVQFSIGPTFSRVWVPQLDRYCCIDASIRASQLQAAEAHQRFSMRTEKGIADMQRDGILQLHGAMQSAGASDLTRAMIGKWLSEHLFVGVNAHREFAHAFVAFLCTPRQLAQQAGLVDSLQHAIHTASGEVFVFADARCSRVLLSHLGAWLCVDAATSDAQLTDAVAAQTRFVRRSPIDLANVLTDATLQAHGDAHSIGRSKVTLRQLDAWLATRAFVGQMAPQTFLTQLAAFLELPLNGSAASSSGAGGAAAASASASASASPPVAPAAPAVPVVLATYRMRGFPHPVRHGQMEVHGRAWSNDGQADIHERAAHTGDDGAHHLHDYVVGYTTRTAGEIRAWVAQYPRRSYNFLDWNCWDFCRSMCEFLGCDYPSSLGDPDHLRHFLAPVLAPLYTTAAAANHLRRHPKPQNVGPLARNIVEAPFRMAGGLVRNIKRIGRRFGL